MPRRKSHAVVTAFILALTLVAPAWARPSFEGDAEELSRAGHLGLAWKDEDVLSEYELQRAPTERFEQATTIYRGGDRGTFISGLRDGRYHFRVRGRAGADAPWSPWSDPKALVVRHWSIGRALGLMALGGLVFALTVAMIVVGGRRAEEETPHGG
jgi:hypothetical protein